VGRGPYALIGCCFFAIKHNLDRFVATFLFDRPWDVFSYLKGPARGAEAATSQAAFYATLLVLALPFIWTGVALTIRRLRDVGWPLGLMVMFFVPFLNLPFFLLLSLVPSRRDAAPRERHPTFLGRLIPQSPFGSAAVAVLVTALVAVPVVVLGVSVLKQYGAGLFVGLPFALGFASAVLHGYHRPRSFVTCLGVAFLGTLMLCLMLLAYAVEASSASSWPRRSCWCWRCQGDCGLLRAAARRTGSRDRRGGGLLRRRS
jgi:hypothetical protein